MKLINSVIIVTLLLIANKGFSQNTYKADAIYFVLDDLKGNEIARKPEGRNASIIYDPFFKSYKIAYTDSKEQVVTMHLEYIKDEENGFVKMKDSYNTVFRVQNQIETYSRMWLYLPGQAPGKVSYISIEKISATKD